MSNFEITVTVRRDNVVNVRSSDGTERMGQAELYGLRRATVEIFQQWLEDKKISRRRELEILGQHLFEAIFNGGVRQIFEELLSESVKVKGQRLRVQLSFEDPNMAVLPWEYLYSAESDPPFFLSTRVDLVLARYLPLGQPRDNTLVPLEKTLRLLIAVSQPDDPHLGPVIAGPVIEEIYKLAEKHPIQIELLEKTTVHHLLEKLEETRPHVLHFIGHGQFDRREKQGKIALLDYDETKAAWIPDSQFSEYFTNMEVIPRLVFLHLCEGGEVDLEGNFAGLAPKLIQEGVQAVVAMQHRITNKAAISFSRAFYRELSKGSPVDQAVQRGRYWITLDDPKAYDNRVFGTPVLYMRSYDGFILPAEETGGKGGERVGGTRASHAERGRKAEEQRDDQAAASRQRLSRDAVPERRPVPDVGAISDQAEESGEKVTVTELLTGTAINYRIDYKTKTALVSAAYHRAAQEGLEDREVQEVIRGLEWKSTPDELRKTLQDCIYDETGKKIFVYQAMLDELNKGLDGGES